VGAPPQPRPMRADARRNREHIVATARQAFAEMGPEAPLDVIARRAGIGPGTLYRHFACRELLIEAVYWTDIDGLTGHAVELAEQHAPREALELWVREHVVPALEQPGVAATLKDALARAPEVFSPYKAQFSDAADKLVGAAQDVGDVRRDVETRDILRMAYGIAVASEGTPEARERMLTVMFDGLRP
jgi:AcrR family transcriptional regulator